MAFGDVLAIVLDFPGVVRAICNLLAEPDDVVLGLLKLGVLEPPPKLEPPNRLVFACANSGCGCST